MPSEVKKVFIESLVSRIGSIRKLPGTQSLYETADGSLRVYIRYSKLHRKNDNAFYGLRTEDLQQLQGHPSLLCFLWDGQKDPLLIPFSEYEEVLASTSAAGDGQYKVQVFIEPDGTQLYIARAGRFNVDSYLGWESLQALADSTKCQTIPTLSHSQVQTLLGAVGQAKGYDIWIPLNDRGRLDWSVTRPFACREILPSGLELIRNIVEEVDVMWIQKGSNELRGFFEVEHSTPVYSALLRFNDILLSGGRIQPRFTVVSNEARRDIYVRQINRPTFQNSGLREICAFLDYGNVYGWHKRLTA
ncbi:MAG TPA: hypothetical protein DEP53_17285 [Bacteroidetes bacterium]|nr:hypothetical protein [Bacteroidota bacterium]